MTSISALIDFLMSLMRDEDTKRAFDKDPEGTMADKGLQDVSAQDVRDARLIMADDGAARPRPDGGHQANGYHEGSLTGGGSAVREIVHTTNTFEIDQSRHTDQTIFNFEIDNSRTNILDSFNSQDTVTAIQDNDTVNNDIDVVNVEDSFNDKEESEESEDKTEDTEDKTEDPAEDKGEDSGEETPESPEDADKAPEPGEDVPQDAMPTEPDEGNGEVSIQPVDDEPADSGQHVSIEPEPIEDDAPVYMDDMAEDLPVA